MTDWVIGLQDVDNTQLLLVGGKGLHLGLLSNIQGIHVPEGFCVTTSGFQRAVGQNETFRVLLDELSGLKAEDRGRVGEICSEIRRTILQAGIPSDVKQAVVRHLFQYGEEHAYAVRSSATAEDLPHASFAGQHDTYLHIIGIEAILQHISKCWASLYTDRAVIYRMQNGFDHRQVSLSVIVQRMVFPQASGILFTADPITSNRKLLSIDAGFGLGEALVSGIVSADCYKVKEGTIVEKRIAAKQQAVYGRKEGGTEIRLVDPVRQMAQTLSDRHILELSRIGRQIEAFWGCPQDIEWCLADDTFYIVQSRPITTLYPVPEANDQENHVYVSVGHQQMMTDPLKPLGMSIFQLTSFGSRFQAGGRLFVDVAHLLASPESREQLLRSFEHHSPLLKDAIMTIVKRSFIPLQPSDNTKCAPASGFHTQAEIDNDPSIVTELIKRTQSSIEEVKQLILTKSGPDLFEFILEDIQQLKKLLFDPQGSAAIMTAMNASTWINDNIYKWLGEKNAADTLSLAVPNNITSEMGLALMDVADVIRPYPDVIRYLQHIREDHFGDELVKLHGGREAKDAIDAFLDVYGMRCVGEIDITKTRWSEKPTMLIPMILRNIQHFEPQAGKRKREEGRQEARKKEQELLDRLMLLPDGEQKAKETKHRIGHIRTFSGYREYPKYGMVNRYFIYKQALLKEAELLVKTNVIQEKEDIFYLTFEELHEAVRTCKLDYRIINMRKDEYSYYEKLTPPLVITSDGEILTGEYKRENLPAGAIVGLPVSSGVIEGRARVILHVDDAELGEGDIVITTYTDPSWTPWFVSIKGLVTEVGGLMTHGAVIAREYGLPAVVGVEQATKRIKDGQRIRVNGTEGYIEFL